jgi:IS1 family transposase
MSAFSTAVKSLGLDFKDSVTYWQLWTCCRINDSTRLALASIMANMNRLKKGQQALVVKSLVEGNSIRTTARMTGVARMTVEKLLRDLNAACSRYQDEHLRNLNCKRLQCDEIWSFVYAKHKNAPAEKQGQFGYGDVWTWVAIDADSKLAVSWIVGNRSAATAFALMDDLASRLDQRIQLTTDGHRAYLDTVENAFGNEIDYSMLVKIYGADRDKEATYSPDECIGCQRVPIIGNPDPKYVPTNFLGQQNLTMRMSTRRFARLSNAFSKKVENHAQSVALHFMYYNFVLIQQTFRITPAMAAGVADKLWSVEDIVSLLSN